MGPAALTLSSHHRRRLVTPLWKLPILWLGSSSGPSSSGPSSNGPHAAHSLVADQWAWRQRPARFANCPSWSPTSRVVHIYVAQNCLFLILPVCEFPTPPADVTRSDPLTISKSNSIMTTIQAQEWHNSGSACCSPIGTCKIAYSSKTSCVQYLTTLKKAVWPIGAPAFCMDAPLIVKRTVVTWTVTLVAILV